MTSFDLAHRVLQGDADAANELKEITMALVPKDPFLREYFRVPSVGWVATTTDEAFAVLATLARHLQSVNDEEGQQLLARLWRLNNPVIAHIEQQEQLNANDYPHRRGN